MARISNDLKARLARIEMAVTGATDEAATLVPIVVDHLGMCLSCQTADDIPPRPNLVIVSVPCRMFLAREQVGERIKIWLPGDDQCDENGTIAAYVEPADDTPTMRLPTLGPSPAKPAPRERPAVIQTPADIAMTAIVQNKTAAVEFAAGGAAKAKGLDRDGNPYVTTEDQKALAFVREAQAAARAANPRPAPKPFVPPKSLLQDDVISGNTPAPAAAPISLAHSTFTPMFTR